MGRAFKIIGSIICLIVVLFIVAIVILATAVDPNNFKSKLEHYVKNKTGRTLTLKGNLSWSFFPWVGFEAQNVTIGNPANFKNTALAKVGDMKFKMHAWSLIRGNFNIKEIILDHANINLITNANNQTNWSHWNKTAAGQPVQSTPTPTDTQAVKPVQPATAPKKSSSQLSINTLRITNSSVHIINEPAHTTWNFNNLNLTLKNFNTKKYFPLKLNFDFSQNNSKNKVHTDFSATASMNLQTGELNVPHIKIYNKIYRPNLPTLPINIQGDLHFNPNKQVLTFQKANLSIANMKLTGYVALTNLFTEPNIAAELKTRDTKLKPLLHTLSNKTIASGSLSFYTKIKSHGSDARQIIGNLNGNGNIKIDDGVIYGINLTHLLDQGAAFINKKSQPAKTNNSNETRFSAITGNFNIKNGTLSNNDLTLIGKRLSGTGNGIINLNNQTINYNLDIKYLHPKQQGTQPFTLPIVISGKLKHASIQPNYDAIAKRVIKNQIENLIKKETEKSKHNIGNVLKGLFK